MVTVETPRDFRMESIVAAFADANLRHQPQGIQVAIPDVTSEEFERAREIVITRLNQGLWRAKAPHLTRPPTLAGEQAH